MSQDDTPAIHPGANIAWAAKRYGPREAVVDGERRLRFSDVYERSRRAANALIGSGLEPDDRVAKLMRNRAEIIEINFGVAMAGGASLNLHGRNVLKEHVHMLNDSESAFLILDEAHKEYAEGIKEECPALRAIIAVGWEGAGVTAYEEWLQKSSGREPGVVLGPDSLFHLHYTSGTTGTPKAVVNTHRTHVAWLAKFFRNLDYRMGAQDSMLHAGPMTHASFNFIEPTFLRGARNVVMPAFEPELFLEMAEKERATTTYLVSTMVQRLIECGQLASADLSSLHTITYGAAPISEENLRHAIEQVGPIFRQTYGLTEARQPIAILDPWDHMVDGTPGERARLASCGRVAAGVELELLDDDDRPVATGEMGEICVRGDYAMARYWNNPEATAETMRNGWVHTGDLAVADEEGYLYIVDRKKEMIITGGFNVYPSEVERALCRHPAVLEALVIGVPDEQWGEAVMAMVVLRPGETPEPSDIIDFTQQEIAGFKKPKHIEFLSEIPKNPQGKVLRREIREKHWEGRTRRVN